jgi:hypothetical protein
MTPSAGTSLKDNSYRFFPLVHHAPWKIDTMAEALAETMHMNSSHSMSDLLKTENTLGCFHA